MRAKPSFPASRNTPSDHDTFLDLRNEISRVFDQFNHFPPSFTKKTDLANTDSFIDAPNMDVTESEKTLQIKIDVPGVRQEEPD
jgi:HSP20 family molecular chaperone IbpA